MYVYIVLYIDIMENVQDIFRTRLKEIVVLEILGKLVCINKIKARLCR